jgi:hypothetical protein
LSQFVEFVIESDPGAGHFRVDLAEPALADPSTGTVTHEFRTFGFERTVGDRRTLVYSPDMVLALLFSGDEDSYGHRLSLDGNALSNNLYSLPV